MSFKETWPRRKQLISEESFMMKARMDEFLSKRAKKEEEEEEAEERSL